MLTETEHAKRTSSDRSTKDVSIPLFCLRIETCFPEILNNTPVADMVRHLAVD
jgi:hypothetical protein